MLPEVMPVAGDAEKMGSVSLIEKAADRQFDPLIVKAFLNCADKFKEIHDKWKTSLSEEGDFIMSLDADKTDKK